MVMQATRHLGGRAGRTMRVGLFAATLGLVGAPAMASETLELDYEIYFGGMHLVSAQARLEMDGDDGYRVVGGARTRGWVNWLYGFKSESTTVGVVNGADARPMLHEQVAAWDDGERSIKLTYEDDGKVVFNVTEQRDEDDDDRFTPLDPATLDNTIDPVTAFVAMSRRLEAGESCNATFEIFDGKRRYDVVLTDQAPKVIEPSDFSVFSGEAIGCHLEYEKIGGFWIGENKYRDTARNRVIWVGRPIENGPPVPVQMTIETGFGSLVTHLTHVRVGGQELALNVD